MGRAYVAQFVKNCHHEKSIQLIFLGHQLHYILRIFEKRDINFSKVVLFNELCLFGVFGQPS